MCSKSKIDVDLPPWCRISQVDCRRDMIDVAEQNLDLAEMLELLNEHIPLADYEGNK